ncbi:hypothetical protein M407DRAFT_8076 [Tulasnella calospora MUT 4182]|uniref:Uncharacterized protein n=1 Tax=Tulasnella calospora MUT 4182 TaxID=1051891 RepID=A0A0C3Q898_9AGAM|nr:hypothetical protein M407DRAFT_8076 [Tulasnella calospora MUT 4182]
MTLEPRLSSRWITNIALATKIVALPSPIWSFRSTTARSASSSATPPPYVHSPPQIQAMLDSILPASLPKAALIKGMRSSSAVVRHLTASLLAHSIKKVGEIAEEMKQASKALEEDEITGSWAVGRKELLKDVSSRIPEVADVARLLDLEGGRKGGESVEGGKGRKQKGKAKPSTIDPNRQDGTTTSTAAVPSTLVHEVASRLMLYYHRYLPHVVAESSVGVRNITAPLLEGDESQKGEARHAQPPLRTVSQLHGLRLLEELESYDWSVKIGTRTALYHVLHKQMTTPHAAIRNAGSSLLQSFFSRSLIFEHDPDEIQLWLSSFPRAMRKPGTTAPDGTVLSDEVDGFLAFFDACLSRCLKTPYRYLEEGLGIISQLEGSEESRAAYTPATVPSPLFFTILEELKYRVSKEKDSWSSDVLAIFAFLRRFILSLLGKQPDLRYVRHLAGVLEGYADVEGLKVMVVNAVRRELKILRRCLESGHDPMEGPSAVSNPSMLKEFMNPSSTQSSSWQYQTAIFTDRLRFDPTTESEDVVMLMASMLASLPGSNEAMRELLLNLSSSEILWTLLGYEDEIGDVARKSIPFHYAFLQANSETLKSNKNTRTLAFIFHAEAERSAAAAKQNANLISLRAQAEIAGHISLAESSAPHALRILNIALGELSREVTSPAVHLLFATEFVREVCSSQGELYLDLTANIKGLLSESSAEDKDLVRGICAYWSSIISGAPAQTHSPAIPHVIQWVPFMSTDHLLSCLDISLTSFDKGSDETSEMMPLLESVLYALMKLPPNSVYEALGARMKALVLLSVQASRPSALISEAVRFVMESILPVGVDPTVSAGEETDAEKIASKALSHWRGSLPEDVTLDLLEGIMGKGEWSQSSTVTATALMYRSSGARLKFAEWLIQSIVQHPQFQLHVRQTTLPATREALVALLESLFKAHPNVTCQPNSITALVSLYTGTQSLADRRMLSVFQLFERHRRVSASSLLSRWSAKAGSISSSAFEAVTSLDPTKMERTFLKFPQSRSIAVDQVREYRDCDEESYDPVFVMLLLTACVNEGPTKNGISWVELFRTNVLSVVVAGVSSREGDIRRMAVSVLGLAWRALQNVTFHERDQTIFVLNRLRHFIPPPEPGKLQASPPRLPTCTSLLFAHTLHCIFYPATFVYPVAMRFLLQRPTFNPNDVPLIFEMLFKGSEDWKQHRTWMVAYLRDSMRGSRDWAVLRKRHAWDLLATIFQESPHDPALRLAILEVFLRFTANPDAVVSLVLRSSLLSWMENQSSNILDGEDLAWAMIIENVLTMSDHEKLDANTAGGWRTSVSHNLEALMNRKGSIKLLAVISRCLLRLASTQPTYTPDLSHDLEAAVAWLQSVEPEVKVDTTSSESRSCGLSAPFTELPITASSAGDLVDGDSQGLWGSTVQALWQLCMILPSPKRSVWDALTSRLLAWHSTTSFSERGRPGNVGEWARKEAVHCMST